MKLSVLIPAHNEEACLASTVREIHAKLIDEKIDHEILVVNDHSVDKTQEVLNELKRSIPTFVSVTNEGPGGYGYAVRWGLERFTGDCVAIMMADRSDSPEDLIRFYRTITEGYDCVFGSRFIKGAHVTDYPPIKLTLNRMANTLTRVVFGIPYNDFTNAFKMYRKSTIRGLQPFLSAHFNLTLELPLKAVVRGYSYKILPNDWTHRKQGVSKLKIKEMGSRYFFIFLYCLIEKYLSKGDYHKDPKKPIHKA